MLLFEPSDQPREVKNVHEVDVLKVQESRRRWSLKM